MLYMEQMQTVIDRSIILSLSLRCTLINKVGVEIELLTLWKRVNRELANVIIV